MSGSTPGSVASTSSFSPGLIDFIALAVLTTGIGHAAPLTSSTCCASDTPKPPPALWFSLLKPGAGRLAAITYIAARASCQICSNDEIGPCVGADARRRGCRRPSPSHPPVDHLHSRTLVLLVAEFGNLCHPFGMDARSTDERLKAALARGTLPQPVLDRVSERFRLLSDPSRLRLINE